MNLHIVPPRKQLADLLFGSGGRYHGDRLSADLDEVVRYRKLFEQSGVRSGSLVVLNGLENRAIVLAASAAWQLDAIPVPCLTPVTGDIAQISYVVDADERITAPHDGDGIADLSGTAVLHVTSGSTGVPKLARRSTASVIAEARAYRRALESRPEDHLFVPIPICHSYGWGFAFSALLNGCALSVDEGVNVPRMARVIDSGEVSVVALTAPLARLLCDSRRTGSASPRIAMVGAGSVSQILDDSFFARFRIRLSRNYGCSETGPTMVGEAGLPPKAIGRPMYGVSVLNPSPGRRGELEIQTATPVQGYYGDSRDGGRRWRTGDIVQHGDDGVIQFLNRKKASLRVNGRFIDEAEIGNVLRNIDGVQDVYLLSVGRGNDGSAEDLYVVVSALDPAMVDLEECRRRMPPNSPVPRFSLVSEFPRDVNGKVTRAAVLNMLRSIGSVA